MRQQGTRVHVVPSCRCGTGLMTRASSAEGNNHTHVFVWRVGLVFLEVCTPLSLVQSTALVCGICNGLPPPHSFPFKSSEGAWVNKARIVATTLQASSFFVAHSETGAPCDRLTALPTLLEVQRQQWTFKVRTEKYVKKKILKTFYYPCVLAAAPPFPSAFL